MPFLAIIAKISYQITWPMTYLWYMVYQRAFNHVKTPKTRVLAYCRRPPRYVPYKGTFVPYDGTYGAPDQGQTLDVWESQTTESALRWRMRHVTILDRTMSQSWIGSWIRPGSLVKRVLRTMTTSWNDRSWSYARSTQAWPVTCSLFLSLIISFLDHQPLLILTTLILVASTRQHAP